MLLTRRRSRCKTSIFAAKVRVRLYFGWRSITCHIRSHHAGLLTMWQSPHNPHTELSTITKCTFTYLLLRVPKHYKYVVLQYNYWCNQIIRTILSFIFTSNQRIDCIKLNFCFLQYFDCRSHASLSVLELVDSGNVVLLESSGLSSRQS